jgi:magnesium transporter
MEEHDIQRPWEALEKLVDELDPEQIEAFLNALPADESARAITRLSDDAVDRLLTVLSPEEAAEVVEHLPDVHAVDVIERLEPETAGAIVQELPSDVQADLLGDLDPEDAEAILNTMPPDEAEEIRTLTQYEDDVAGGLMVTEFLAYPQTVTIADVLEDLAMNAEMYRSYHVQYIYVCDHQGHLVGVLRLRSSTQSGSASTSTTTPSSARASASCSSRRPAPDALWSSARQSSRRWSPVR